MFRDNSYNLRITLLLITSKHNIQNNAFIKKNTI